MTRPGRLLAVVLFSIAACSADGGLEVVDAWARPTPEVADSAAFYVTVSNDGPDVVLQAAEAAICDTTALHDTVLEDGVMEMRLVDTIVVSEGDDLVMEPGGLHIMCLGLEHQLMEGEEVEVSVLFEDGVAVRAAVSVEDR